MRSSWLKFLVVLLFTSLPLIAQAQQASKSASTANHEAVKRGEIWFYTRCALCHMPRIVKDTTYQPLAADLKGILKNASPAKEAEVRQFIQAGTLGMPGFKYNLSPKEFDELIAFLKTF